jgi:pimeloyl-ACP methyl ester carboxylesterase
MDPALHTAAWRGEIRPGPALEWPALALIRSPAILIYGVHSIPLERAIVVAQTIPNCQLVAIPYAAHDLPNENPVSFISALRAFLTETPDATERPREGTVSGSDLEL